MDAKVFYTNAEVDIQCAAVRVLGLFQNEGEGDPRGGADYDQGPPLTSSGDAIFLLSRECYRAELYLGSVDGVVLALRFCITLRETTSPGGSAAPEHHVILEEQRRIVVRAPAPPSTTLSAAEKASSIALPATVPAIQHIDNEGKPGRGAAVLRSGVQAIETPTSLPIVFLLADGRFLAHQCDTLQSLGDSYVKDVGLSTDVAVLLMCAGAEQAAASHQLRPTHGVFSKAPTQGDGMSMAASDPSAVAYFALLLEDSTVVLVECTQVRASRLVFVTETTAAARAPSPSSTGTEVLGKSEERLRHRPSSPAQKNRPFQGLYTQLAVSPGTCTMAWCRDMLITGSRNGYCLYDTLRGVLLSRLEMAPQELGWSPYVEYLRNASMDCTRTGFAVAAAAAKVCSGSVKHSESGSSYSGLDSGSLSEEEEVSDDGEGSDNRSSIAPEEIDLGWPLALVFRHSDGILHICLGDGTTNLAAAVPMGDGLDNVSQLCGVPPFLAGRLRSTTGSTSPSNKDSLSFARERSPLAQLRRASRRVSTLLGLTSDAPCFELALFSSFDRDMWVSPSDDPIRFTSSSVSGTRSFPLGIVGFSRHMVELLLWRPFMVQLDDQMRRGQYARALRFVSQCFRGTAAERVTMLHHVCETCANHAMSHHRYRIALFFYALVGSEREGVLRPFPELWMPHAAEADDRGDLAKSSWGIAASSHSTPPEAADTVFTARPLTYASSAPYRTLFRILFSQFTSLASLPTEREAPREGEKEISDSRASLPAQPCASSCAAQTTGDPRAVELPSPVTESATSAHSDLVSPSSSPPRLPQRISNAAMSTDSTSPCNREAVSSARTTHRAAIEFALFCLFAMDHGGVRRVHTSREELLEFMVSARTLETGTCSQGVHGLGIAAPSLLRILLVAAQNEYGAAMALCHRNGDAAAAGVVLTMCARSSTSAAASQLDALYQLHLPWMLEVDPQGVVQLLTDPTHCANDGPGHAVLLPLLLPVGGTILLDYLGFLLSGESREDPMVHQLYAMHLINVLQSLREDWGLQAFASNELGVEGGAGSEIGIVGRARCALSLFLRSSVYYDKERVLASLREAGLYEEQCIVLEALEDHIGVLTTMVYSLKDLKGAVQYCTARYAKDYVGIPPCLPFADTRQPTDGGGCRSGSGDLAPRSGTLASHEPSARAGPETSCTMPLGGGGQAALLQRATTHGGREAGSSVAQRNSYLGKTTDSIVSARDAAAPFLPSRRCQQVLVNEVMTLTQHGDTEAAQDTAVDGTAGIAVPPRIGAWEEHAARYNPYLHVLLHVLLVPPASQAVRKEEAVWLLCTHSTAMNPHVVLSTLPGDLPLRQIAPYLIRSFQRLELNHQAAQMEAAAVQSACADAKRRHGTLQERCIWVDDNRRCVACGERLEPGSIVAVFPNLKPVHARCHQNIRIDPERGVPYLSSLL